MARIQKKKVSTIPLSRRGKKRYILFLFHSQEKASKDPLAKSLHAHFLSCFGTLGLPAHRVKLISFDTESQKGIVRCAHTSKDSIISALLLYAQFQGHPASIRTLRTSGTLKALRTFS